MGAAFVDKHNVVIIPEATNSSTGLVAGRNRVEFDSDFYADYHGLRICPYTIIDCQIKRYSAW